jgi:hypothetical protein
MLNLGLYSLIFVLVLIQRSLMTTEWNFRWIFYSEGIIIYFCWTL